MSTEHKTIEKLGHTPKTVKENEEPADCITDGSYDEVVYCDVCGEKLSTEHKTIDKLGHNYKDGVCYYCGELHYNVDELQFKLSHESYYIVSGYNGNPTYANIPDTYLNKPVTSIAANAFKNCSSLTSVIIPDSITTIGASAFERCSNLESITIGKGVTTIGDAYVDGNYSSAFEDCSSLKTVYWNATNCTGGWFYEYSKDQFLISSLFGSCNNLTTVVIGENVQSIPRFAFENLIGLKSITIPESVTSIGNIAFRGCTSLESVYWNATDCTGGWFNDGKIDPIFYGCDNLTTVVFGENVQSIPKYLFYYCDSLKTVIIPDGVTSIGDKAFYKCSGLESITIGKNVTTIGHSAFQNCTSLEIVYWNAIECECGWLDGTTLYLLFSNCDNLTTLVIGEDVEAIPEYTFYKCSSLESVIIPAGLYCIEKYAFYGCSGLKTVYYLGGEDDYFITYTGNTELMDALYYYSEDEPTDDGQWWHYDENGNMVIW